MPKEVYRYRFMDDVDLEDLESTLTLTVMAVESLHGESQTRLDVSHLLDSETRTCVVDASTLAGRDFNRLLVGFLQREFGDDAFEVERVDRSAQPVAEPVAA